MSNQKLSTESGQLQTCKILGWGTHVMKRRRRAISATYRASHIYVAATFL
ncbi:MAG: hypothetical protein ACR2KS_04600 [Candidatus Eremiobacter antarcticus]|nr:hypothetical protein [Candidatus Eremiobacteraeota bacterium]